MTATIDLPRPRDAALARLLEARAEFREQTAERYASGARIAGRDSDRLELIAVELLAALDVLERRFDTLDAARDLCAYLGPDGLRIERAAWPRDALAAALAEVFEPVLHSSACAVLQAAVRLQAVS